MPLHRHETLTVEQSEALAELQGVREQLSQENEELKLTVKKLLARLYGNRRERHIDDPNQLKLDFGDDPAAAAAFVLQPLAEYYHRLVLGSGGLGCDETTVTLIVPPTIPAIDPNDPRSKRVHEVIRQAHQQGRKSINARMWAYRAFEIPVNVFDFTVSRHRDGPDEFLQDFAGHLMADCW